MKKKLLPVSLNVLFTGLYLIAVVRMVNVTPEPVTMLLFGTALIGLASTRKRK